MLNTPIDRVKYFSPKISRGGHQVFHTAHWSRTKILHDRCVTYMKWIIGFKPVHTRRRKKKRKFVNITRYDNDHELRLYSNTRDLIASGLKETKTMADRRVVRFVQRENVSFEPMLSSNGSSRVRAQESRATRAVRLFW